MSDPINRARLTLSALDERVVPSATLPAVGGLEPAVLIGGNGLKAETAATPTAAAGPGKVGPAAVPADGGAKGETSVTAPGSGPGKGVTSATPTGSGPSKGNLSATLNPNGTVTGFSSGPITLHAVESGGSSGRPTFLVAAHLTDSRGRACTPST